MRKATQEDLKTGVSGYIDTLTRIATVISLYLAASSHPPLTITVNWIVVTLTVPLLIIFFTHYWQ
jgi:hypothetical protein